MDRSEIPCDTRHLGVISDASKLISEHMVRSMQTVQLSCIKISTISKHTEPSFHLSLFIQENHRVHPKWFLRVWCIRHKPCTYLASKLTLSPNRPKRDIRWYTSTRSSIGCVQINFQAYGTFHANHAPILHEDSHYLQINRTELSPEPLHLGVSLGASTTVSEPMVH